MGMGLTEVFETQAEWRRQKASEYPDDKRNIDAAECFNRLAATAADVSPELTQAYEELGDDCAAAELHAELLNQVGFHWLPDNASEFVAKFISHVAHRSA